MRNEHEQFLDAYNVNRVDDQIRFYENRTREYTRSARQTGWTSEFVLVAATVCGVLAAMLSDQAVWFGVIGAGLAAVAAAITSWSDVVGFEANAEMYRAARGGLGRLRPHCPTGDEIDADAVDEYVTNVEEILLGEVRTWSQKWTAGTDPKPH